MISQDSHQRQVKIIDMYENSKTSVNAASNLPRPVLLYTNL
jgi:hypothetical protein